MQVVGGGARVAAQQLAAIFAHAAELHVVVVLLHLPLNSPRLLRLLFPVRALLTRLPLDALLFLEKGEREGVRREGERQMGAGKKKRK